MVAAEYEQRDNLKIRDRDWALLPRPLNPAGGWSSIANPGDAVSRKLRPDRRRAHRPTSAARCSAGAEFGRRHAGGRSSNCAFQYTFYDNLINKTKTGRYWGEVNYELSDASTLHFEALYSNLKTQGLHVAVVSAAVAVRTGPRRSRRRTRG